MIFFVVLTFWDSNEVEVHRFMSFENVLIINGQFLKNGLDFAKW